MREWNDPMVYLPDMQQIPDDIMNQVLLARESYDESRYTERDVERALDKDYLNAQDFAALLSPAAGEYLEPMAQRARAETRKHFGNAINLFTPLYIANYCENHCIYCGFNCTNKIHRARLNACLLYTSSCV